jgi:hypothetical protein
MSGWLVLERLSDGDLALLAEAASEPGPADERVRRLRARPERVDDLLARPEVFDRLFGRSAELVVVAPFLAFSVLVARTTRTLETVPFVLERVGSRERVPIFDVERLRDFLDDPLRRFFLAELLTSYTRVASGAVWSKTARGWRRRRFSELDPVRLAELSAAVPEAERLLLHRRLGDLSLFLSGVFPDHAQQRLFGPSLVRVTERLGAGSAGEDGPGSGPVPGTALELLEALGRRAYRLAWEGTGRAQAGMARVLREVADRFEHARRVLNFLTERYLFPERDRWFPSGA